MSHVTMRFVLAILALCLVGISGVAGLIGEEATSAVTRDTITRDECTAKGGAIVGDIGNGAIFQPDYVCESTGAAPTHTVVAGPGEPIASEGEVCCGGTDEEFVATTDGAAEPSQESSSSGVPPLITLTDAVVVALSGLVLV